jgi:hypothetical protein
MFLATKYPKKSENPKKAKKKNFFYSSPFVNHRRLERWPSLQLGPTEENSKYLRTVLTQY